MIQVKKYFHNNISPAANILASMLFGSLLVNVLLVVVKSFPPTLIVIQSPGNRVLEDSPNSCMDDDNSLQLGSWQSPPPVLSPLGSVCRGSGRSITARPVVVVETSTLVWPTVSFVDETAPTPRCLTPKGFLVVSRDKEWNRRGESFSSVFCSKEMNDSPSLT